MADVELVIRIPEELYGQLVELENPTYLAQCVINGKQLPKGHGRLIDADELSKDDEVTEWITMDAIRTGKNLKMFSELFLKKIAEAHTIIEADKENEE